MSAPTEDAKPLRIGLAGLGTVAQGVLSLLRLNSTQIHERAGRRLEVVRIASRSQKPGVDLGGAKFDTSLESLQADDIDVVVELIGGVDTANDLVSNTLSRGIPVIHGNKALLASYGEKHIKLCQENRTPYGFEAAVAGGIPIILTIQDALVGNQFQGMQGIINGTCNFILSEMSTKGSEFSSALQAAQELGYAEADPSFDIEGIDAAQKLAILCSLMFGTRLSIDELHIEGITTVTPDDLHYADRLGYQIKHLAIADRTDSTVVARVHPTLVKKESLLSAVLGSQNAVSITADGVGNLLLSGPGAGSAETASSVLSDLVRLARGTLAIPAIPTNVSTFSTIANVKCQHYLYIPAQDIRGTMAEITNTLSSHQISIDSVVQIHSDMRSTDGKTWIPVVILTDVVSEKAIDAAVTELSSNQRIVDSIRRIRVSE